MGCVYRATNTITGKVYIGMTTREFKVRKLEHIRQAFNGHPSCMYFHSAILKYGADSFVWEIIFESDELDLLNFEEAKLIKECDSFGKMGYNLCHGGGTNAGYVRTEETLNKLRGQKRTKDMCANISKSLKGRKCTEEHKANMSAGQMGVRNKSIRCIELDTIYESIKEASETLNIPKSSVSKAANKKLNKTHGYTFEFLKE